jgi:hypothetical protein
MHRNACRAICGWLFSSITLFLATGPTVSQTPQPTATNPFALPVSVTPPPTFSPDAPLEITFDGVYSIMRELRQPILDVLAHRRERLPPEHRFTVSAYRDVPNWVKVTLVPTRFVESGWSDIETIPPFMVEIVLLQSAPQHWSAFLVGSPEFEIMLDLIPAEFLDYHTPLPPLEGGYRFPWQSGTDWWAIQGWHDGNAVDFQPGLGARFGVLASEAGRLREICSDGYQSLLRIEHADGHSTYYLHVKLSLRVRRRLLDHNIQRGQYLGELIQYAPFVTPCGRGFSRHLHFAVSDRSLPIETLLMEDIASTASCCANPPLHRSTNQRVDSSREESQPGG